MEKIAKQFNKFFKDKDHLVNLLSKLSIKQLENLFTKNNLNINSEYEVNNIKFYFFI